jgi:arginyl-tRNA synthetase
MINFNDLKLKIIDFITEISGLSSEEALIRLRKTPSIEFGEISFLPFGLSYKPVDLLNKFHYSIKKFPEINIFVDDIKIVNGYINFYLNKEKTSELILKEIFEAGYLYGFNNSGKGKTVIIEMSSPNIAKEFGIGHLRSTIIGESLSRIYKANGYKVIKINYLGDWGTNIGKVIYGFKKWGDEAKLEEKSISYFQELYVRANLEMNEETEKEIRKYFSLLEKGDRKLIKIWKKIKELSLKKFNEIYNLLGVNFDVISGESEYQRSAHKLIETLLKRGIAQQSRGSIIVDLQKENLGVAILRKSDGTTTYLARDLAAAIERKRRFKFYKMIYEVGAEQKLHFQQLFTILEKMGYEWSKNLKHVSHGLYLGETGGKLSTREGTNVSIKNIWNYIFNIVSNRMGDNFNEEIANKITRAAIFYADLKHYREDNIKYDLEAITNLEGNTGPYLLYSYARCASILRKANFSNINKKPIIIKPTNEEYSLIFKFSEYPEIVKKSAGNDDPSLVAKYSYELSKEFNSFYEKCKIIGSRRKDYRLQLIYLFSRIFKNSLNLLGIDTVEQM